MGVDARADMVDDQHRGRSAAGHAVCRGRKPSDDGAADLLDGGTGADALFFGAGDTATGGTGADDFGMLANSIGNGLGAAVITDYDSREDALFLVLDDIGMGAPPLVTVEDDGDDAMDRKKASMSGGWIVPPSLSLPSWEVTMLPSPKMAAMVLPIDDAVVLVEMNIVANAMRRGMKIPNNHTIAR